MTDSIDKLHRAIWDYIDRWQIDRAGPWWEADLSLDIGLALSKVFGQRTVEVANSPSFLEAWPRTFPQFRQFGSNNYFRSNRKTAEPPDVEQEVSPKRGGRFPDFYYRKGKSDDCEWVVELKLWSVNGNSSETDQVDGALKGLNGDAAKWSGKETYPFVLLVINIPSEFDRASHARLTYTPDDFAQRLVNGVRSSTEFQKLNSQGDGVVVIKSIDETSARLVSCLATSRFANSSWRPEKVEVTEIVV